ncbi:hypothetical protein [Serratia fonticola]|uniref:hypothetical protein n=1 Tax=Serratia fonticola TaxID=47917 RepID=UPI00141539FD|nr:hypothetical protein [Serratia fonticola]NXZ85356.1 hypothetical protein [Serratia fonticola]QIP92780.1 hypothetical protein HAP32_03300 [Serratia fonticola]
MNKSQRFCVLTLFSLLFLLLALGAYRLYSQYQQTHFNCEAMLLVHKDDVELALMVNFIFQGNHGIASLKGTLKQGDKTTSVSRKNYFDFNQMKQVYHLKSISAVSTPADNSNTTDLARYLPLFYLEPGLKFDFTAYPASKEGYVFSTGQVPSFYCAHK